MTLLLDSHTFLWFITNDKKLSAVAKAIIEAEDSRVLISVASLWEIVIKSSLGKLSLKRPIADLIREDVDGNEIEMLSISAADLTALSFLPQHHRDPFDRLIVAQAIVENIPLISADELFDRYGVQRIW